MEAPRCACAWRSEASPALQRQRTELASNPSGLKERDLIVRELLSDELSKEDQAFPQKTLRVPGDTFQVLLLGKDGGVKAGQPSLIFTRELFGIIDGMPMRQEEMRRQRRN